MRIALDPCMHRTVPLLDLPAYVSDLGYDAIELSPREDLIPLYSHPRVGASGVQAFREALTQAGVEIVSVRVLFGWSSADEAERQAAVRYWKRAIALAVELGCRRMNSEFGGRPDAVAASEGQLWRSMDELLPMLEAEDMELALEPCPGNFVEDGNRAVDIIRGIDSPLVRYLYCAPHTFHIGADVVGNLRRAKELVTQVHLADSFDHRASSGRRYVLDSPGSWARVHQHLDIGQGEVDFEVLFAALKAIKFDGILTSSVSAWEERADESSQAMRQQIGRYVERYLS